MTAPQSRPRVVTAAFWCWVVASIMLIGGGLLAASATLPAVFRGAGVVTALAGAGMAFLAGRGRSGDMRFRRAAIALALTVIVLVALLAVFGVVHILTLLSVIPLIAGAVLMARSAAMSTPEEGEQR